MASSNAKAWLEQAWADWIRPLGLVILAGLGYAAYKLDFLGERPAGIALTVLVIAGVLGVGVIPAFGLARNSTQRAMLGVLSVLALVGVGWPCLRVALVSEPLATARLSASKLSATLDTGSDGPYEVVVAGRFKQAGASDVEATYAVKLEGVGQETVSGSIKRALHRFRTSRRGGTSTSVEEHTEAVHRVDTVRGGKITVASDGIDELLDGTLEVSLRAAGPRPEIFWALAALAALLGLILDTRLVVELKEEDRKVRGPKREQSFLTITTLMLLVFSINFPMEATPRSLVRAAIGAFVLALLSGGAGGWLLAAFARLATKPKRKAA